MDAGLRFDRYDWTGGTEAMLRLGPIDGPVLVVAPPLFEEANRTRATIVAVLRGLAGKEIASALPDLPGQGESEMTLETVRLDDWRRAYAAAVAKVGGSCHILAIRSGALVAGDAVAAARLHLSPVAGRALVTDLLRARRSAAFAAGERPVADDLDAAGPPLLLAGNLVGRPLLRDLMESNAGAADQTLTVFPENLAGAHSLAPGAPPGRNGDLPRFRRPWIASEPSVDSTLVQSLTCHISQWIRSCVAS